MLRKFDPSQWEQWLLKAYALAAKIRDHYGDAPPDAIFGLAGGGMIPATLIAQELGVLDLRLANIGRFNDIRFFIWPTYGQLGNVAQKRILAVEDDVREGSLSPKYIRQELLGRGAAEVLVACIFKHKSVDDVEFFIEEVDEIPSHPWKNPTGENRSQFTPAG